MVVLSTAVPLDEPELAAAPAAVLAGMLAGAEVAPVVDEELAELPQANRAMARAASPAAVTIFRIRILPFSVLVISH